MSNCKIAFFLGAGMSAFIGLPTTSSLMTEFKEKHKSCTLTPIVNKYENIEELYNDVNKLRELNKNTVLQFLPNLRATDKTNKRIQNIESEEYIKRILNNPCKDHSFLKPSEETYFKDTTLILEELAELISKHVFVSLKYKEENLLLYADFIERMVKISDKVTNIITTNYDLLIEHSCNEKNINLYDGFSEMKSGKGKWKGKFNNIRNGVKLLKLHGSLNWDKDYQEIPTRDSTYVQYNPKSNLWIKPFPQKDEITNIVFKSISSEFTIKDEPFNLIQNKFVEILKDCNLLVVIGFSFKDKIWKEVIEKAITKGMRLLYITPKENFFTKRYEGSELIIKDKVVQYKNNDQATKDLRKTSNVDYFIIRLSHGNFEIFDVIKHIKQNITNTRRKIS